MLRFSSFEYLIFAVAILKSAYSSNNSGTCDTVLKVTNDGPVTLDVPATVSATLECADDDFEILYVFEDDSQRKKQVNGSDKAEASFIFKDYSGFRSVKVTAYVFSDPLLFVVSETTSIQVEDYIPGILNVSGIIEDTDGRMFLGTGSVANISVQLQYPRHVLNEAEFAYSWTIEKNHFTTGVPFKIHRFTESGPKWIRVAVVGRIPSYDRTSPVGYKWGYFDADITVKDPFSGINISGNTYLEHGELLNLDISCNGSGPVEYCWKVLPPNENKTNLSCSHPVTATECSFPVLYYFRESGDHLLAIYVNNFVTSFQQDITVHIYDVSLRPQLSTVIIPVVCTVLVFFIIAGAVVLHMRSHSNYDIETANFDFLQTEESSAVAIETSWQIMCRSLLRLLQPRCLYRAPEGTSTINYGSILLAKQSPQTH